MESMDKLKEIEKIFPDYFERFKLPDGAKEESIEVYRAGKTGKCDRDSFLPTFEENNFKLTSTQEACDPGIYSLSTFEKPVDIKRFAFIDSEVLPPYSIAIGKTEPKHGLVQRTRERTQTKKSHVDWWLYTNARPYEEFEIIKDFKTYYENYKKNRGDNK